MIYHLGFFVCQVDASLEQRPPPLREASEGRGIKGIDINLRKFCCSINPKPLPRGEVGSFPLCARQSNPETPTKESGESANRERLGEQDSENWFRKLKLMAMFPNPLPSQGAGEGAF